MMMSTLLPPTDGHKMSTVNMLIARLCQDSSAVNNASLVSLWFPARVSSTNNTPAILTTEDQQDGIFMIGAQTFQYVNNPH